MKATKKIEEMGLLKILDYGTSQNEEKPAD